MQLMACNRVGACGRSHGRQILKQLDKVCLDDCSLVTTTRKFFGGNAQRRERMRMKPEGMVAEGGFWPVVAGAERSPGGPGEWWAHDMIETTALPRLRPIKIK